MKKINKLIALLLVLTMVLSMSACKQTKKDNGKNDGEHQFATKGENKTEEINGATVFHALKNQVNFDSTLSDVENPESLFEDLPVGADVTLSKGPNKDSDQLGMVEVENEADLNQAETSVNNYLQNQYNTICIENPDSAIKFENVAIWKYDVYIVFCITINYTEATQIINNTIGEKTPVTPPESEETESVLWRYEGGEHILYEVQDGAIKFTYFEGTEEDGGDTLGSFSYVKYKDQNYTYYRIIFAENDEMTFVEINDELVAIANCSSAGEIGLTTPYGVGLDQYVESWAFVEGSDDPLPTNLDRTTLGLLMSELFCEEPLTSTYTYRYYAQSKLLFVSNEKGGAYSFYVESDGSVTYVEGISLVHQTRYPKAIITGANYVIVDTD